MIKLIKIPLFMVKHVIQLKQTTAQGRFFVQRKCFPSIIKVRKCGNCLFFEVPKLTIFYKLVKFFTFIPFFNVFIFSCAFFKRKIAL